MDPLLLLEQTEVSGPCLMNTLMVKKATLSLPQSSVQIVTLRIHTELRFTSIFRKNRTFVTITDKTILANVTQNELMIRKIIESSLLYVTSLFRESSLLDPSLRTQQLMETVDL